MDAYLNIINSQSFEINDVSYLTQKDSSVFIGTGSVYDSFFGTNPNDILHFGVYDMQKNIILYSEETSSAQYSKINYLYEDVDGNSFRYHYYSPVKNYIFNSDKSLLVDVKSLLSKYNITSSNFYILTNPVTNVFSENNKLIINEIGSSKKELKLIPEFNFIDSNVVINVTSDSGKLKLGGSDFISIPSGIVYTFEYTGNVGDLFFSKTNCGSAYTTGILFVNSDNKLVLDLTKVDLTNSVLWLCNKRTNIACRINITGQVNKSDYLHSNELLSFDKEKLIISQIYADLVKGLNSFNVINFYYPAKEKFPTDVENIKQWLNFQSDSEFLSFVSNIYYGKKFNSVISEYRDNTNSYTSLNIKSKAQPVTSLVNNTDSYEAQRQKLQQQQILTGIYTYIVDYLNFNYDFLNSKNQLSEQIKRIVTETIWMFIETENTKHLSDAILQEIFDFLYYVFDAFVSNIFVDAFDRFDFKFNLELKNALYFENGQMYPIVNWRIDFENDQPVLVVKLQKELDSNIAEKTKCKNICNISIKPFLQSVSVLYDVAKKVIKLTKPNFAIVTDNQSDLNSRKTPYFNRETLPNLSTDIKSAKKLKTFNTDFSDFKNFIVFSSALLRIKVFENKMIQLATLNAKVLELQETDNSITSSTELLDLDNQINEITDSFDFYESYLYDSGKFEYDVATASFIDSDFVTELEDSARIYDSDNRDSLANNTPEYIYSDSDNDDYLKFLGMIGHHFDNLYLYISNFAFYNKIDFQGKNNTSDDILKYVLDSFGLNVAPCASGGSDDSTTEEYYLNSSNVDSLANTVSLNEKTKTVWKRILLNLPAIYKSKGTEECIRYILSVYGIPENLVTIKEFGGGNVGSFITSSYVKNETIYAPEYIGGTNEYVEITNIADFYRSVEFKFGVNSAYYTYRDKAIVPIYHRYVPGVIVDGTSSLRGQTLSVGIIKETENVGRVYVVIKNSDEDIVLTGSSYNFVSEPVSLFDDSIYHMSINRKDSIYDSDDTVLVDYEIRLTDMTNVAEDEFTEIFTFELNPTQDSLINDYRKYEYWGNVAFPSRSIDPAAELLGMNVAIDDSSGSFAGIPGISNVINDSYFVEKFVGTLDKMTYFLTSSIEGSHKAKIFNYDCYSDGLESGISDNLLYRFNFGYPLDILYSSSLPEGYSIDNFNKNYSSVATRMFNFTGSNLTSSLNTSSCVYESSSVFPHQTKQINVSKIYFTSEVGPSRFENQKSNYIQLINQTNTLFPQQSATEKMDKDLFVDSGRIGIFLSPLQERNEDMLNSIGTGKIISSIASPTNIYSYKYEKLDNIRNNYYSLPRNRVLFNELFEMYKLYVDKGLFATIKQFLPARNKSYVGVVVEPTILERSKIESKPVIIEDISVLSVNSMSYVNSVSSDFIPMSTASMAINTAHNISYVDNTFNGFAVVCDVPDVYQNNIYNNVTSGSNVVVLAYDDADIFSQTDSNVTYRAYVKHELKSMASDFYDNSTKYGLPFANYYATFKKLILVKSGSIDDISISSSIANVDSVSSSIYYSYMTGSYYNNLAFKPLISRIETYLSPDGRVFTKSKQTSTTTIKDATITEVNTSPVISTTVGNVLIQQN